MSPAWNKQGWQVLGLAILLGVAGAAAVRADDFGGGCCQHFHCPHTKICTEGPPKLCFRQGCALPIINPCNQPHWGYYQPCWTPNPWGPDWGHCPVATPSQMVFPPPGPQINPGNRLAPQDEGMLPIPRIAQ